MTRQQAINAMCKACIYDPIAGYGTWRRQVANCTSFSCALYQYRPLPRRKNTDPRKSEQMRQLREKREDIGATQHKDL